MSLQTELDALELNYGVWINCNGGPYTELSPRGVGYGIATGGWGPMFDRLRNTCEGRPVLLHNPFGRTTGQGLMEFDQRFNCERNPVTKHIVDSFQDGIEPFQSITASTTVYIGAPHNSQRMNESLNTAEDADNWLYQSWYNTQPIIDGGCNLAIDNMGKVDVQPYEIYWLLSLRDLMRGQGAEVWIESTTEMTSPLHDEFPMFIVDDTFTKRHIYKTGKPRFFNVDKTLGWYSQQVGVLIRPGDYPNRGDLVDRVELLNGHGVTPMLLFTMLEGL